MARSSIYVGEIAHQSPIPNASRIGNIIVSGLIRGADPATAKLAATLEQQCAFMFLHMRQAVEAGGATVEDIIKVTVWMKELQRKPVNDEWVKMFPDPASRPARQIMEVPMEAGVLVQCDFMAVIEVVKMNFGITLSNRGVLVGLCSARDLLVLADAVEACAADGLDLVRRCAVREPPARRTDAARGGRRPHRAGAAGSRLHGIVRAARSAGLRL